jgi:hypothetical protein
MAAAEEILAPMDDIILAGPANPAIAFREGSSAGFSLWVLIFASGTNPHRLKPALLRATHEHSQSIAVGSQ